MGSVKSIVRRSAINPANKGIDLHLRNCSALRHCARKDGGPDLRSFCSNFGLAGKRAARINASRGMTVAVNRANRIEDRLYIG